MLIAVFIFAASLDLRVQKADSLFDIENYASAESIYTGVLATAQGADKAACLKGLGNIRFSYGAFDKAYVYYNDALSIFKKIKDRRGEARIAINLGSLSVYRGTPDKAIKYYDRALVLVQKIKDPTDDDRKDEAAVYLNRGQVYEDGRQYDRARGQYQEALAISAAIGYERGMADSYYHSASLFQNAGEADSALLYLGKAQRSYRQLNNGKGAADCLREAGNIHRKLSDYTAALDCFFRALDLVKAARGNEKSVLGEAELCMYIGRLYLEMGKYHDALQNFTAARKIFEGSYDRMGKVSVFESIAQAHLFTAMYDSALYYYEQAQQTAVSDIQKASLVNNAGIVYEKEHNYDAAMKQFRSALDIYTFWHDSVGIAKVMGNMANCALAKGDYNSAIIWYQTALSTVKKLKRQDWEVGLFSNLGRAQQGAGRTNDAIQSMCSAVDRIEALRGNITSQEFRSTYFEDKIKVYEELVSLYCDQGDAVSAFNTAERAKARAFLDLVGSVDLSKRDDIDPGVRVLIEKEQRLARKVEYLTGSPQQPAAIVEHVRVTDSLARLWPEYAALRSARPVDVGGLQSVLDSSTAFVEYFLGVRKGFVFVVRNKKISVLPLGKDPAVIYQAVDSLRREVRRKGNYAPYGRMLFNTLLSPVYSDLASAKRVGIVPHGVLHHLPFSLLVTREDPRRLLIEDHDIFYVPSASVFEIAHRRNTRQKDRAVVFAKSDFAEHPDWFDVPLPGTNIEKDSLLAHRVFPKVIVFSDRDSVLPLPTESSAKRLLDSFDIIHFATHGKLDEESPLDSRIVLGADPAEDGNLKVREIFNLAAHAYLITLSACETGRLKTFAETGKYGAGDELTGLSRAFIYAGAASVVASLWKVSDASTALLMVDFYERLKDHDKAGALCAAQRRLMKSEYYAEPFYWAPFVVIGDWR
ncbi:MAG TPA: CHAT domain-containing tetratricopeptide repeat protein [bacterium]